MQTLNNNEIQEVNGGVVALYWVGVGAVHAYRTYSAVRFVAHASAGGALWDGIKSAFN
ncbi:hypothetical protein [Pseudoalteromonas sp. '520P1 No. 423']|uniref:hypothetical protein n=1 Tax=Pseudoalteromonas sp. '520P1 No. 423' TaxID=1690037 RepID=UPI000ADAE2E3|nr:hypothetical protein [Pseudoalteromonas sp. '520P1 No. 423']